MPPLRFDRFIARVAEATGISSQSELADALGVNRSAITQARHKGVVPEKWLLLLFRTHGLSPDWLETGRGQVYLRKTAGADPAYHQVPKVRARLSAGGGSFEAAADIEGFYAFRSPWLTSRGSVDGMVLMDIFGNSMEPELKDGDTVLVDTGQKDILAGAIYAVGVEDTILVKRLEKHPRKLVLRSDNPTYAPIYLEGVETANVRIIGKVIWGCREFR